jgi:hypothetical protein
MKKKMTKGTPPLDQVRDNKQMRHHNNKETNQNPKEDREVAVMETILHWEKIIF